MPTAAHFIYIPGVLLVGIVIGWILGSRAAADAYAAKLDGKSRENSSRIQENARSDGAMGRGATVQSDGPTARLLQVHGMWAFRMPVWQAGPPDRRTIALNHRTLASSPHRTVTFSSN